MYTSSIEQRDPVNAVFEQAAELLKKKFVREGTFCDPHKVKEYLKLKMIQYEREVFAVMMLDNQNRQISFEPLFFGTIDAASVYPREVVKAVLQANAAAVILTHNHPSGVAEPSDADRTITQRLKEALALIDVRILDHIVVGEDCVSFAERGIL